MTGSIRFAVSLHRRYEHGEICSHVLLPKPDNRKGAQTSYPLHHGLHRTLDLVRIQVAVRLPSELMA